MRKSMIMIGLAALTLTLAMALPASAGGGPTRLFASMNGDKVQPGPGDQDGLGRGQFKLNLNRDQFCYRVDLVDVADVTGAHIFEAPAGETGPAVIDLQVDDNGGRGCTAVADNILRQVSMHPHDYYIEVATEVFPNGAVRGQLGQH